ncbi:hypothetical protein [Robertmurraya massiliosenegalensis]|uniref:hypothetical protein n=1 Tax=Robertmurraya massiliosenegalensis TaxID=1287657 RepID=UPI0002DBAA5B|nr:hypothetical protein [Robertmurraya massiliosenegalensis]
MSATMYRNKVQGLEKEIANIEKDIGKEQEKLAKALKTIQSTKSTSTINSKQRELINTQKK